MSKAAECSLLSHNERDINTWRQRRCQMMWKQIGFKQKPSFILSGQNQSRCPHSGATELPEPPAPSQSSKPKSHRQGCALSVSAHTSVPADSVRRAGMCGVGSGYRTGWIVSKGYYPKKTLLYAWANMVNCIQLAQGKVRHILKQRKAISGRCIQFREIYYPQRNMRKKILIYFISAYST